MNYQGHTFLSELAVIVEPALDHVAVAKVPIAAGTVLDWAGHEPLTVKADIPPGHRFAICPVPPGEWVQQYGQPFARSRGLEPGDPVTDQTVDNVVPQVDVENLVLQTPKLSVMKPLKSQRSMYHLLVAKLLFNQIQRISMMSKSIHSSNGD